jgi:pimeloyl-ACP methyl ester carboxylesterase
MILELQNGQLHYEVTELTPPWVQEPETIMFCHGVAINCDIWAGWLPILAPHFRIVRFDTRGFGRSYRPGQEIDWSMDLLADDILQVAEATGTKRFHLVGESMGGTACLQLACRPGAPLLSLTCVSTPHRGARIQRVGEWRDYTTREGIVAWSEQMMDRRFYPSALPKREWDWFSSVQQQTAIAPLLDAADLLMRTDLSNDLQRIAIPTLLLAPDASPFLPLEIPSEIHRLIPHSEVAVFPRSRHGLPFSHAKACADTLLASLQRHRVDESAAQ